MGIYVTFWHCHPAGLVDEFLGGPLDEFESWLAATMAEFPGDIEGSAYPLLKAVRANGRAALEATTSADAMAVDRLMDAYFGMFCDMKRAELKRRADQSMLYSRYFEGMFGSSDETAASSAAFRLWSFILKGRPGCRDPNLLPYESEDGVYRLSYWTLDEVKLLREAVIAGAQAPGVEARAQTATKNALAGALEQGSGLIIEIA